MIKLSGFMQQLRFGYKKVLNTFYSVLLILLVSGCFKDSEVFIPYTQSDSDYALKAMASKPKSFIIDVTSDTTVFKSETGNILTIPKNSLLLPDGTPVSGKIKMLYAECNVLSDYVFNGISTFSTEKPVYIYHAVFVNFYFENDPLMINPKNRNIKWIVTDEARHEEVSIFVPQINEDKITDIKMQDENLYRLEAGNFSIKSGQEILSKRGYSIPIQLNSWNLIGSQYSNDNTLLLGNCVETDTNFNPDRISAFILSASEGNLILNYHKEFNDNKLCIHELNLKKTSNIWLFVFKVESDQTYSYFMKQLNVDNPEPLIKPAFKPATHETVKNLLDSLK